MCPTQTFVLGPKQAFVLALIVGVAAAGCRESVVEVRNVPDARVVEASEIPASANARYFLFRAENTEQYERGARRVLEDLLREGIRVKDAYYPIGASTCMAPTPIEAFLVDLVSRDDSMLEHGFRKDPLGRAVNCGIDQFQHFDFED